MTRLCIVLLTVAALLLLTGGPVVACVYTEPWPDVDGADDPLPPYLYWKATGPAGIAKWVPAAP